MEARYPAPGIPVNINTMLPSSLSTNRFVEHKDENGEADAENELNQRNFDETLAGERFIDGRRWIEFTEKTRGEISGQDCKVWVRGPKGWEYVNYTQTREYHCTGGTRLVRKPDNTYGCEEVVMSEDAPSVFSIERARAQRLIKSWTRLDKEHAASLAKIRIWKQKEEEFETKLSLESMELMDSPHIRIEREREHEHEPERARSIECEKSFDKIFPNAYARAPGYGLFRDDRIPEPPIDSWANPQRSRRPPAAYVTTSTKCEQEPKRSRGSCP